MGDWQPIETGPKDGTPVLIFDPGNGGCNTAIWRDGCWENAQADPGEFEYSTSTHWMPLPAPPK